MPPPAEVFSSLSCYLIVTIIQCFSYRRFFASLDASSLIWTQVERFGRFFQVQFSMRLNSPCRTTEIKIEVQSKYRGMNSEQIVSTLFTKHADVFPALCVVASAAAVLPVTNASPEQGIFNPEQDFDKAAKLTFGRNPRPADENLHRRYAKQPDGLSQGFAAVAISANPPHFMSWSGAHGKLSPATVGLCLHLQQL